MANALQEVPARSSPPCAELPRLQEAGRVFPGKIPQSGECLPGANCHQLLHEEPQKDGVSPKYLRVAGTVWVITSGLGRICPQSWQIVMACVPRWDGRGLPALMALKCLYRR